MRITLICCLLLTACAAPDPRVAELEARVAKLESAPKPEPPKPDPRVATLEAQLAKLTASQKQRHAAMVAQLSAMAARGAPGGAQVAKASLTGWGWLLTKDRKWVVIGDGELKLTLDLDQDCVLVMTCNGHCMCEPSIRERGDFGRDPHHDKWLTLSFFVDGRNVPIKMGFREFHPPQLGWGQIHTHPAQSWNLLTTTQMVHVKKGKREITLRAMQNSEKGRWRMHGIGMYVVAIPLKK